MTAGVDRQERVRTIIHSLCCPNPSPTYHRHPAAWCNEAAARVITELLGGVPVTLTTNKNESQ